MHRCLRLLLCGLASLLSITASPASADFDYEEETLEISVPGVDLATGRTCSTSMKTTITLQYRASTDTYYEAIKGSGRSTCSTERLALNLTVIDESPAAQTYQRSAGLVSPGTVAATAAQNVPARLVAHVTYRWNFVPQFGTAQCFQKTYTVVKGAAPRTGDTKPCGSLLETSPEEG